MLVFDLGELQLPASLTAPLSLSALREALSKVDLKAAWQPIIARVSMPLIRTEHGIYLDRNYQQETVIIDFFKKAQAQSLSNDDIDFVKQRLAHYFKTEGEINWQKFAAANAILNNENSIITVSTYDENNDVYVGLPCIINNEGINKKVYVKLNEEETEKLEHSIKVIKEALNEVK